jgi:hypothetical protein
MSVKWRRDRCWLRAGIGMDDRGAFDFHGLVDGAEAPA